MEKFIFCLYISVFGMAYFTDMDADTYADYCSIHQTLQQSLVDGHTSYQDITSDDLRQVSDFNF